MENLIYKKINLCILYAQALKTYDEDPVKFLNKIVNDSKNELEADLNLGNNIITGLNNPMTKDIAIEKGKVYALDLLKKNTDSLMHLIANEFKELNTYITEVKTDLDSAEKVFVNSNSLVKMNLIFKDKEKSNYFINILDRDFINKLASYNNGLNININLNKLLIILRKGLSNVNSFDVSKLSELHKHTSNMIEFTKAKENDLHNMVDADFLKTQLDELLKGSNLKIVDLKQDYKKVGDIIKEIALNCPELETVQIDIEATLKELHEFIMLSNQKLRSYFNLVTDFISIHSTTTLETAPKFTENIKTLYSDYVEHKLTDSDYENKLLNNILILVNMVNLDRIVRKESYGFIQGFKDLVCVYLAIQSLYLNMGTYTSFNDMTNEN